MCSFFSNLKDLTVFSQCSPSQKLGRRQRWRTAYTVATFSLNETVRQFGKHTYSLTLNTMRTVGQRATSHLGSCASRFHWWHLPSACLHLDLPNSIFTTSLFNMYKKTRAVDLTGLFVWNILSFKGLMWLGYSWRTQASYSLLTPALFLSSFLFTK